MFSPLQLKLLLRFLAEHTMDDDIDADFITFYKLCIEYKRDGLLEMAESMIEDTHESYRWWSCERDMDFEEIEDFHARLNAHRDEQLAYVLKKYPRVDLCRGGAWLCIPNAKKRYLDLAAEIGIPEKEIVSVWKEGAYSHD